MSTTRGAVISATAVKGVAGPSSLPAEILEMGLREKSKVVLTAALAGDCRVAALRPLVCPATTSGEGLRVEGGATYPIKASVAVIATKIITSGAARSAPLARNVLEATIAIAVKAVGKVLFPTAPLVLHGLARCIAAYCRQRGGQAGPFMRGLLFRHLPISAAGKATTLGLRGAAKGQEGLFGRATIDTTL